MANPLFSASLATHYFPAVNCNWKQARLKIITWIFYAIPYLYATIPCVFEVAANIWTYWMDILYIHRSSEVTHSELFQSDSVALLIWTCVGMCGLHFHSIYLNFIKIWEHWRIRQRGIRLMKRIMVFLHSNNRHDKMSYTWWQLYWTGNWYHCWKQWVARDGFNSNICFNEFAKDGE